MSFCRILPLHAALLSICLGCTSTVYVVELTPTDDALHRTLQVVQVTGNNRSRATGLSSEHRDRVIDAYALELGPDDPLPDKMEGIYADRMPDDIGGFGSYHQFESPLGVAKFYTERFRGSLDLTDSLRQRQQSLDEAISLIQRWAVHEWPSRGKEMAAWIDTTLRQDLHNVLLLAWTHSAALAIADGKPELAKELFATHLAYLAQYAAELDYLQRKEIPVLFHAVNTEDADATLRIARQILSRKLKQATGRDYDETFKGFFKPERLRISMRDFLRTTDEYQVLLQKTSGESSSTDAAAKKPDPLEVITGRLFAAFFPRFMFGGDRVEVQLHLDQPPIQTNGNWDEETHSVQWVKSLQAGPIPPLAYAVWIEPNDERQQGVFGAVKIDGDELAMHATWYAGLNENERERWNDFLATVETQRQSKPNDDLILLFENALDSENDLSDSKGLQLGFERIKAILSSRD